MRVITANVNGVRAAVRRGGLDWLAASGADVLCLQEVRAAEGHLRDALAGCGLGGWHVAHTEGAAKGRAGVAVVSRLPLHRVRLDVGVAEFAASGRWVEAVVEIAEVPVTVASTYVHAGEAGTARQDEKLRFLDAVTGRLERALASGEHLVVCGDLNVAHTDSDLKNWKGNRGKSGCLPEERACFDRWVAIGMVDLHRRSAGAVPGPYTWWSWRGKAFDTDAGWRIDYQWATPQLAETVTSVDVGRAPTYAQRWSDHAPVVAEYALEVRPDRRSR